jgi:hypothetical protein
MHMSTWADVVVDIATNTFFVNSKHLTKEESDIKTLKLEAQESYFSKNINKLQPLFS